MSTRIPRLLFVATSLAFAAPAASSARADVPAPRPGPPEPCPSSTAAACAGKKVGDACLTGGANGTCQALRCTNDAGETLLACSVTPTPTPSAAPTGTGTPSGTSDGGCAASPMRADGPALSVLGALGILALAAGRRRRAAG